MDVPLITVIEFMVFLGYDGKLEANSDMEKELFLSAIDQLKERFSKAQDNDFVLHIFSLISYCVNLNLENKEIEMTNIENALIWLYVKTWGKFGEHIIEQNLWNFTGSDLETAIMGLAYPRKRKTKGKEKSKRVQALNDLIMGKFKEGGIDAFRKWSGEIHDEVIDNLPDNIPVVDKQVVVKILKWDLGEYNLNFRTFDLF